ncbi:putative aldouronate transport system permease protein [Lacrimispora xylanisolvens]|uniref:Putative aldouronate transport system permease protein n=1 Tax=Lacrimispora xylanisolvens TaxID=384636 RepID=A0A2S6HPF6_9FIRM|nr:carbohydrate ABC transporter permease [Hungatella xylanolytica]MBE5988305.1 carbohydrate ABC transporter permease [Paenibacillaceae bacterium]PPK79415.1 putative aldouronate transport system permease protein [Hungatella xylanolytica]
MSELKSKADRRFQLFWNTFFVVISIVALIPIIRVVSMSLSSKDAILGGKVFLYPVQFTVEAYVRSFHSGSFVSSFIYSVFLMLGSTFVCIVMTVLAAYPLSKKNLKGGAVIMTLFVLTMYLDPGIIPKYLNVKSLKLIDTVWALIIPEALSAYNMIIMCTAFKGLDSSLYEAAKIDGCNEVQTLFKVALPLVYPTLATLALFYAVGRWNRLSDVLYYVNSSKLYTVQMVLKQLIEAVKLTQEEGIQSQLVADNIKSASIVISMTPMVIAYPFIQKYFTKGIMLGAVKG